MKKLIQGSKSIIIILCACILSLIPFYIMMIKGIYCWRLSQPEFYQGGIEVCLAMVLIYLGWLINKKRLFAPMIIISCIYLSINGVIIPTLTAFLYIGILLYIGYVFKTSDQEDGLILKSMKAFISGIAIWGLGAIILSLLNKGTINDLRIYTIVLFIVACIWAVWKKKETNIGIIINQALQYKNDSYVEIAIIVIMIGVVLALFAKTNTALDYDSLWYGLRSENVLVGQHSFYDNLGYMAYVYFYPKFSELLFLPINSLGDYSFIFCANIVIFLMAILAIYYSLKRNINGIDKKTKLILLAGVASIPAFANISATAKADILGFYLVLCAFVFMQEYIEARKYSCFVYAIVALGLCTAVKLTYILWGGILFIWGLCVFTIKERKQEKNDAFLESIKNNCLLIVSAIVTIIGVHYRTYKLTGYIIYPTAISLWNKVFHNNHGYYLTQSNTIGNKVDIHTTLSRLYEFIFDPQPLGHVIMLWTSNILLVILVVWILFKKKKIKIEYTILMVVYILTSIYYMVSMSNPDGNYFILPIIVSVIIICGGVQSDTKLERITIKIAMGIVLVCLLPIMFISHSSWAWGTKAFSKELIIDNFETEKNNQTTFIYNGVNNIVGEVSTYSVNDKVIASSVASGLYFRFPCNLETYYELSLPTFSNAGISQYGRFKEIMQFHSVRAVIVDKNDETEFPGLVAQYVQEMGTVKVIEDQGATCYVFR